MIVNCIYSTFHLTADSVECEFVAESQLMFAQEDNPIETEISESGGIVFYFYYSEETYLLILYF